MIVLDCENVDEALYRGMCLLADRGVRRDSRNGPVLVAPCPVATIYRKPTERVLTRRFRDANPFFHFYESLWMLAGRKDLAPLIRYVSRFSSFSDDGGKTQNAAYGHRLRVTAGDQLSAAIYNLRRNRADRRVVLSLHDPTLDTFLDPDLLDHENPPGAHIDDVGWLYTGRDAACNLTATLQVSDDALHMVVFCRSNDIIWGCYGANAVHFSAILEYVARHAGLEVGSYTQVSVNWHAYVDVFDKTWSAMMADDTASIARYGTEEIKPRRMISEGISQKEWDRDVRRFVTSDGRLPTDHVSFADPFFRDVAWPIVRAHDVYKNHNDVGVAIAMLDDCVAGDWRFACTEWLNRRRMK